MTDGMHLVNTLTSGSSMAEVQALIYHCKNKSNISYLKPARPLNILIHALKSPAGSHSQSDSGSVIVTSASQYLEHVTVLDYS